ALPHGEVAAGVEVARLDLVAGEMRHHRHGERLARLLGIEAEHARDRASAAERHQVGVVPAARRGREGVERGRHHLVAERERGERSAAAHSAAAITPATMSLGWPLLRWPTKKSL